MVKTIARFKGTSRDLLDVDTPRAVEMLSRRSNTTLPKATATALNDAISVLKNFESVNDGAHARFAIGGIFTGSAAGYANRSRQVRAA